MNWTTILTEEARNNCIVRTDHYLTLRTSVNHNCCQNPYVGQRNEWGYNPTDG